MFRTSLGGGCRSEHPVGVETGPRNHPDLGDGGFPDSQRAGLVEDHGADPAGGFERRAGLDQDAGFRPLADADDQRDRRRQPEGAGTGDHHHCQREAQRRRETGSGQKPCEERHGGNAEHRPHEPAGDPVGQPGDRRARALRILHQLHDPGEHGVAADPGRLHHDRTVFIHRRAGHFGAGGFFDRHGFAAEHRLVHAGFTLLDHAVHGDAFAGLDPQPVARLDFGGRNHPVPLRRDQYGGFRCEFQQLPDRAGGAAAGTAFEEFSEHDQCDDHPGGVEVEMLEFTLRAQIEAVGRRGSGAAGDQ